MSIPNTPVNKKSLLMADHFDGTIKRFYKNSKGEVCCLTDREVFVYEKLHKKDTYTLIKEEEYTPPMKVLYGTKEG